MTYQPIRNRLILNIIIIFIIITQAQPLIKEKWSSMVIPVTMRPTYFINANVGQNINLKVIAEENNNYYVAFYKVGEYYPEFTPWKFIFGNGSAQYQSGPVDKKGTWRAEIIPRYQDESFIVKVHISIGGKQLGRYADVSRVKRIIILNYDVNQDCSFNVKDIQEKYKTNFKIEMYQGTKVLNFEKVKLLYSNQSQNRKEYTVNCLTKEAGFHYIYVEASSQIALEFPMITIQYQSNDFSCPFENYYRDINTMFKGCSAHYCLKFEPIYKCSQCREENILQNGQCYANKTCQRNQYFDKGLCKNGPSNCNNFQNIGGKCVKCNPQYQLVQGPSGLQCQQQQKKNTIVYLTRQLPQIPQVSRPQNQQQVSRPQTQQLLISSQIAQNNTKNNQLTVADNNVNANKCRPGQFLSRGTCYKNPQFCQQADPNTRICTTCLEYYSFNPMTLRCEEPRIYCDPFYTNIGNQCIPYPDGCIKTNSLGACKTCKQKYILINFVCQSLDCSVQQVIIDDMCVYPIQNCFKYDRQTKKCSSCKPQYIFTPSGLCIKQIVNTRPFINQVIQMPTTNTPVITPDNIFCRIWQNKVGIVCVDKDVNCIKYDEQTGDCLTCKNETFFINRNTGMCSQLSDQCKNRYYFDIYQKKCIQVNFFCEKYAKSNGACTTCKFDLVAINGVCISYTPCPEKNQYRTTSGICANGDADCLNHQHLTGLCKQCKPFYQLNNGICCRQNNYLEKFECKKLILLNCKVLVNSEEYCKQCIPGFRLLYPKGKCQQIK